MISTYCQYCGSPNHADAVECRNCGRRRVLQHFTEFDVARPVDSTDAVGRSVPGETAYVLGLILLCLVGFVAGIAATFAIPARQQSYGSVGFAFIVGMGGVILPGTITAQLVRNWYQRKKGWVPIGDQAPSDLERGGLTRSEGMFVLLVPGLVGFALQRAKIPGAFLYMMTAALITGTAAFVTARVRLRRNKMAQQSKLGGNEDA